jgi:DNA topoisomerase-1
MKTTRAAYNRFIWLPDQIRSLRDESQSRLQRLVQLKALQAKLDIASLHAPRGLTAADAFGILRIAGSAASGNFGHSGRPGTEGGSAPSASGHFRAADPKKDIDLIHSLRIPPAGKNVRLNPNPDEDLRATWTDVKGRTQYRYSAKHTEEADAEKFERRKAFNKALPKLQEHVEKDLRSADEDISEPAAVIHLINKTGFRIGSTADTKADDQAYGATTLEADHVKIHGDHITFNFPAKSGQTAIKEIKDATLAKILKPRLSKGGKLFSCTAQSCRDYMQERIGDEFTPKDFRTWHGTDQAQRLVDQLSIPKTDKEKKESTKKVAEGVASFLGNTPTVALKSYIDHAVFRTWGGPWKPKPKAKKKEAKPK